ncbi:MAG: hypothetical protein ACYC2Y_02975 [Armatimonadota bacterium]
MSTLALAGITIGTLGLLVTSVVMIIGAVTSRAEDEYWAEFWLDTPTTESPRFKLVSGDYTPPALKRAA